MDAPIILVEGLRKSYGSTVAVDDISFHVQRGEIFGLLGPNGAGKTTTVECLQGLRRPDRGTVRVLGLDPQADGLELRRRIGSQLQDSGLPARMRVSEALDLFATVAGRRAEPASILGQWGIADKRDAAFASLSGGQQQRLFVALALLNQPEVVFLDEMTTGLDPAARRVAWDLIREIRERGTTVVLVTHFMDEAERLCDRVAVVARGRVVALDTPEGLIAHHAPEVRLTFACDATDVGWLEDLTCVRRVERRGRRIRVEGVDPVTALVSHALLQREITPEGLRVESSTLEDVFLRLTGEAPQEG
ncbi:MAG TPA: ABC transporter ATP-binding protein [Actinomycetota bacterium]|nr:ABC transporter ATP-binding protein [Actinomycetota bacterium]